jgi:hypothetical protein
VLRVVEKRIFFFGEVFMSIQCSEWLVSTLEVLLGVPEEQDFVKSFWVGSKVLIVRRGGNKAGCFLEAVTFGMGGRKGFILIPEGCGGWGWHKFSSELRKAIKFLSAAVGRELASSCMSDKVDGEVEGSVLGLAPKWTGPSFVEVLRLGSVTVVKEMFFMEGRRSSLRDSLVEPCALDLISAVRFAEEDQRSAVDCTSLEYPPLDLLDKDQPRSPLGKKPLTRPNSKFKILNLRRWSKLVFGFNLVMGRALRNLLGWFAGLGWAGNAQVSVWAVSCRRP